MGAGAGDRGQGIGGLAGQVGVEGMGCGGGGKMCFKTQIALLSLAGLQLLPDSHKVFVATNGLQLILLMS